MRRTQLVRPGLCGLGCVVEQEWDDEDHVPQPRTVRFHARCSRHAGLSEAQADAAIIEEAERFNTVASLLQARNVPLEKVSARMDGDVLEVSLPPDHSPPGLPLAGVRFV